MTQIGPGLFAKFVEGKNGQNLVITVQNVNKVRGQTQNGKDFISKAELEGAKGFFIATDEVEGFDGDNGPAPVLSFMMLPGRAKKAKTRQPREEEEEEESAPRRPLKKAAKKKAKKKQRD